LMMKRDDFGMRIDEIRELATKYSKPDLARMVQMGMLDPQRALMAGMMIDRIAKSAMQPPQTTVAEDVLSPQMPTTAQGQMPEGIMAAAGAPAPSAGVAALPSGMREMAGGGIVAFADGGDIPGYADGDLVSGSDTFRRGLATQTDGMMPPAPPQEAESGLPMLPGGFRLREYERMAAPSIQSEFESLREADRLAGVDTPELFRKLREEESGRREELKKRREEAKGEALLMAGLGLMGARRGQEFEVLANVGRQAAQQYGASLRDIRDTERDIKKSERELMMAEDRFKRDQSSKSAERLERKQIKYEELKNRSVDQYNDTVKSLAKMIADEKRVDQETATRMAIAEIERRTRIEVETMQQRRAGMGSLPEAQAIQAQLKKTNPNATIEDAYAVLRGGKTAGMVTDKELQDAYEARLKDLIGKTQREDFLKKYPTWREFADEQRGKSSTSGSASSGAARPSLSSFDKP
jgi:hypothetical protein